MVGGGWWRLCWRRGWLGSGRLRGGKMVRLSEDGKGEKIVFDFGDVLWVLLDMVVLGGSDLCGLWVGCVFGLRFFF